MMPITRRQLLAVGLAAVGLAAVPRLRTPARDEGLTLQELRDAMGYADRVQPERAFLEQYKRSLERAYIARDDAITALGVDPYDRVIHAPSIDALRLRFNAEDVDSDA